MRFKRAWSGSTVGVIGAVCVAVIAFAAVAVAVAATGSNGNPPPIRCAKHLPAALDEPICPTQGQTVDIAPLSGRVFVTQPGDVRRRLDEPHTILVTSIIDARHGRFRITADQRSVGIPRATADFSGGVAQVVQGTGPRNATVTMHLVSNFAACGVTSAASGRSHHKTGHLFGHGKGHFGIAGQYASAIVQGTKWSLTDFCDGSGVNVQHGTVAVNNFGTGKTVLVHTGQSYFSPATAQSFVFPATCPRTNVPLGSTITITGQFTPANVSPAPQIDYTAPSGATTRHTLTLDPAGNFSDQMTVNERGVWSVSVHLANAAPGGTPASCSFLVT